MFGSATPSYQPPPAPPPSAAPPTLASGSVVSKTATNQANAAGAYGDTIATPGGAEGVNPASVSTAKETLGGVK